MAPMVIWLIGLCVGVSIGTILTRIYIDKKSPVIGSIVFVSAPDKETITLELEDQPALLLERTEVRFKVRKEN